MGKIFPVVGKNYRLKFSGQLSRYESLMNHRAKDKRSARSIRDILASMIFWWLISNSSGADRAGGRSLRYETPTSLTATIYEKNSTNILFKFKRTATHSGTNLLITCDYSYLDGKPAIREIITYAQDRLVSQELDDRQIGATGSVRTYWNPTNPALEKLEFQYRLMNGKIEQAQENLATDVLNSDMVGPFLADHWADLISGRTVKCRQIVIPRKPSVLNLRNPPRPTGMVIPPSWFA